MSEERKELPEEHAVRRRSFTEQLPVPISADRHDEVSRNLAATIDQIADAAERRRISASGFKAEHDEIVARQKSLAEIIQSGTEPQQVECCDYLLRSNEVVSVRLDTGEVFARRPATMADRQESLIQ